MKTAYLTVKLPDSYFVEIGKIITYWASIEHHLKAATYLLSGVDPAVGRLAVREPRVSDHVTLIEDLVGTRKIKLRTNLSTLRTRLAIASIWRDKFAHCPWVRPEKSRALYVRVTKAKWQAKGESAAIKNIIRPKGEHMTIRRLRGIRKWIMRVGLMVEILYLETLALERAFRDKFPPQPLVYPKRLIRSSPKRRNQP